jgi:uncharacterized protein (DUF433 family)
MDDLSLMRKYNLSARGLQSLFRQLGDAGIIKHINARSLIRDLRSGMTDTELMEKYDLSRKGFHKLLDEMDDAGILDEISEPMAIREKTLIHRDHIVQEIRSGATRQGLMEKYRLTSRGLRWITTMLVSSGAIGWDEIVGHICSRYEEIAPDTARDSTRLPLGFQVPVSLLNRPDIQGTVRNVSDKGLCLRGIRAKVGEARTILVAGDEAGAFGPFAVDATCKWTGKDSAGEYVAGFEISNISLGSLKELQLLVRMAQVSASSRKGGWSPNQSRQRH